MSRLELRIPPDVVWVVVAALMWLASRLTPGVLIPSGLRLGGAAVLAVAGIVLMVSARSALADANTTWHPMTPAESTNLVTTGVFGISRNPIYLGMLLVMLGFAVVLSSPVALLASALFVLYLDRFQIAPEERVLFAKLGQEYAEYQRRVRRWV